jgi:hypothetical protein
MPIPKKPLGDLGIELPVLGFGGVIICADEVRHSPCSCRLPAVRVHRAGLLRCLALQPCVSPTTLPGWLAPPGPAQFADAAYCREFVQGAVSRGATYIDVAPEYGDGVSQARLGPALEGKRDECFLACKTMFRDAEGAAKDLATSLEALRTDHLDLYQCHSVTTKEDVDEILGPGGCLEVFKKAKADGTIKHIGFSAHDEEQALRLIETGEFETVLFPLNFMAHRKGGVGADVLAAAKAKGMGILGLKAYAKCRLKAADGVVAMDLGGELGEQVGDPSTIKHIPQGILSTYKKDFAVVCHPKYKCWYTPEDDPGYAEKLFKYTLSLGATSALAPGNAAMWEMGMKWVEGKESIDEFDEADVAGLDERYDGLTPIFNTWCAHCTAPKASKQASIVR